MVKLDEAQVAAWVDARCLDHLGYHGGVPREPTEHDLELFACRFKRQIAPLRESLAGGRVAVSTARWEAPTTDEIKLVNALWTKWRVARFGSIATEPPPERTRWRAVPQVVRDLLGRSR